MNRGEYLEQVIKEKGYSIMTLSRESGVPYTTIKSMISRDLKNASIDNVIKICDVLGIKAEDLAKPGEYKESEGNDLTAKDERDIQKELKNIINNLNSKDGYAAFDGNSIEELDEEDRELLISSLENSLRLAKRMAKEKFTPIKYKEKRDENENNQK